MERCGGGDGAGTAVHASAGVSRGRRQIEAPDGSLGPAEPGDGPEDQLLVQLRGAAVERPAAQVLVRRLEVGRLPAAPLPDEAAEAGSERLDPLPHPLDEA